MQTLKVNLYFVLSQVCWPLAQGVYPWEVGQKKRKQLPHFVLEAKF